MISRRTLLTCGAGAAMLGLAPAGEWPGNVVASSSSARVQLAVHDWRFDAATGFAATCRRAGVVTAGMQGDVTDLWFSIVAPRLRQGRIALIGLTTWPSFVCLGEMCRSAGISARFVGRHSVDRETSTHRLCGSSEVLNCLSPQLQGQSNWATEIARTLLERPAVGDSKALIVRSQRGATQPATELVSWLIS